MRQGWLRACFCVALLVLPVGVMAVGMFIDRRLSSPSVRTEILLHRDIPLVSFLVCHLGALILASYMLRRQKRAWGRSWRLIPSVVLMIIPAAALMLALLNVRSLMDWRDIIGVSRCVYNLCVVDGTKEVCILKYHLQDGGNVDIRALSGELSGAARALRCPLGAGYIIGVVGEEVRCPIHGTRLCYRYPLSGREVRKRVRSGQEGHFAGGLE